MAKQWLIATTIIVLAAIGVGTAFYLDDGTDTEQAREKRPSNVNVVQPKLDQVRDVVVAVGTLRSRQEIELTSEVSGRIVELNFAPGDPVAEGQLLVRLEDRQAQADLRVSNAQYVDAKRQYDRAQSLRSNNSISQAQVDALRTTLDVGEAQLEAARTRLNDHRIEAPFAGVVGLVDVSVGAYLNIGDSIATLDATDRMELTFSIPERYLGKVTQGQVLTARTAAFPDRDFGGTLAELGTRINELSRSLPVKAMIDNSEGRLRPGQFMSVSLTLQEREALVIPEQAVLLQGSKAFVFVANEGEARRIEVGLGSREPGLVEITEGISAEDSVIITGQDRLSSGDKVAIVEDDNALVSSESSTSRVWQ